MISTGNEELDKIFKYGAHITGIYGKPATGKTTLCLLAMSKLNNKKVVFIDTEKSFSLERLKQFNPEIKLDHFFVIPVRSFSEQHKAIEKILGLKDKIDLVIIDSFSMFYRKMLQEKHKVNPLVARQMSILSELTKNNTPVIITCQVYSKFDGTIEPIGRDLIRKNCGCLIRLENKHKRTLHLEKHPEEASISKGFCIKSDKVIFS